MTNKSLGRGLSAFLNTETENEASTGVVKVNTNDVKPNPYQPRQFFDDEQLQALAASIKRNGILQPILVRKLADGSYQLVAGERRLRASKIAELQEIPAIITDFSPEKQLEIAILENVQRENLNPIEEAEGYKRLIDEFHHTQDELAEIIGKSRSHISNIMRLLNLPKDVQELVKDGKLSFGHARALVTSENASEVAHEIVDKSLNVRDTEKLVKKSPAYVDPEVFNIAHQIEQLTGLKTHVKLKGNGGTIELCFENLNQLDNFIRGMNR